MSKVIAFALGLLIGGAGAFAVGDHLRMTDAVTSAIEHPFPAGGASRGHDVYFPQHHQAASGGK
jgi:hypothetical protein